MPTLYENFKPVSNPFDLVFDSSGDFTNFKLEVETTSDEGDFAEASMAESGSTESVRG